MAEQNDDVIDPNDNDLLGNLPLPVDDDAAPAAAPAAAEESTPAGEEVPAAEAAPAAADEVPAADAPAKPAEDVPPAQPAAAAAAPTKAPAAPAAAAESPAPAADPDAAFWAEHDALAKKLESGEMDGVDLTSKDLAIIARGSVKARERADRVASGIESERTAAAQVKEYDAGWDKWQASNPTVPNGKALWEEELTKARAEHGNTDVAVGAAKVLWGQRVAIIKGKHKPAEPAPAPSRAAPAAKAPIKPAAPAQGRTAVAPISGGARPAPAKELSAEDLLVKETGGDGKGFLS